MSNKPQDPRFLIQEKRIAGENSVILEDAKEVGFERFSETSVWILVAVYFASAFTIYSYFNRTLVTVLETSQLFMIVGLIGFLITYFIRKPLQLSIIDGLFYNLFGSAPLVVAIALVMNSQCTGSYVERYRIIERDSGTCMLENDALDAYWHIRNIDRHERNPRGQTLEFTFCDGFFGYRVMQNRTIK